MTEVIKGLLYIGSFDDIRRNGSNYDYIINMADDDGFPDVKCSVFHFKAIDVPSYDISQYFDATNTIIDIAKKHRKTVIVNCRMGISRSATVVIAYLMKEYNIDEKDALDMLREVKRDVNPNSGFIKQLKDYYYTL